MKGKTLRIAWMVLVLIWRISSFTGAQTAIYVAPTGGTSGIGTPTAPVALRANLLNGQTDAVVHFAPGTYNQTAAIDVPAGVINLKFERTDPTADNPIIIGTAISSGLCINLSARTAKTIITIDHLTFRGFRGNNSNGILFSMGSYSQNQATEITLDHVIIEGCSATAGSPAYLLGITGAATTANPQTTKKLTIQHSTIRNCSAPILIRTHGNGDADNNKNSSVTTNICYNSIYNNTTATYLMSMYAGGGTGGATIYNNTFSNNTGSDVIYFGAPNLKVINNTFYKSGQGTMNNNSIGTFVNNIFVATPNSAFTNTTLPNVASHNIFSAAGGAINYCTTGTTMTTNLASDFGKIFDVNLDTDDPRPGRQYHRLINMDKGIWNIGCGESVSSYGLSFTDDQIGVTRQTPFALGSYDRHLVLDSIPTMVFINPGIMAPRTIDLSQYITNLPGGSAPVTYAPVLQSPSPNSSMSINGSLATITPGANTEACYFEYMVAQGSYQAVGRIYARVYNFIDIQHLYDMPGIVNPALYSCFDYMGAVEFTSNYRFRTGHTSSDRNRIAWSSTPLVADLDHDGYPEIIALCIGADNSTANNSHGGWTGISIYDGRTGTRISRLPFTNGTQAMTFTHTGWHSATPFSLVDSDRDGTIEMIIAFTHAGTNVGNASTGYIDKLVSYKIVPSINAQTGKTTGYTLEENPKWSTTGGAGFPQYNTGNTDYHKAIPQICDFDGDGEPEVLVYNKIYSAVDGSLKLTMEGIGTSLSNATAYMGLNRNAPNGENNGDRRLPFSCIYDMDGDGVYDVVAGGKIYKMNVVNSAFSAPAIIEPAGGAATIGDGYTAVADIDGDGLPDVVVVNTNGSNNLVISVWNPDKGIIATRTVTVTGRTWGSNSYVFVGDIDGRVQIGPDGKEYRLPEIAVLTGRVTFGGTSFPPHPNVASIPTGDDRNLGIGNYGGLPTSGTAGSSGEGCLFALTYDLMASAPGDRLKGSFILEHADNSNNTGFTMFDFDNDGIKEICYRDMRYLRIIKPVFPYIKLAYVNTGSSTATNNHPEAILLRQDCGSTTGFEYPVIADVDNDGSAEIVLPGCDASGNDYYSFLYVIGNGNGDKFAPAWPVWNQYMYDPFKINPDLKTPVGSAKNRLKYKFTHEVKDEQGQVIENINDYNPFNGNLKQATKIDSSQVPNYEPIVFLTEAYIEPNTSDKGPKIRGAGTGNTAPYYIELTIGNRATAQTDISSNTPVAVYRHNSITHANRTTYRLSDLYAPGTTTALGTGFTVKAGEETTVWIPVGSTAADANNVYIVRLGDDSDASNWRFGYNGGKSGTTYPCAEFNQGTGLASRAFRDCDWCDQVVRAARYRMFDDFHTVQAYNEVSMNILANDILPNNSSNRFFPDLVLAEANISTPPRAGSLTFNGRPGANNRVTYHHEGQPHPLLANIDSFEYKLTFFDESLSQDVTKHAWVYIYIMNSAARGFAACYGAVTNIELQNRPDGVSFEWYKDQSSSNLMQTGRTHTTGQMFADSIYWLKPVMTNISTTAGNGITTARLNHYQTFDFPRGKLTVSLVTPTPGTTALMRWTGLVSTEWQNPNNWIAVKTDANGKPYETPVTFAPTECTNVIIPSTADFYPELGTDTAYCADILMKDRAMLKNPHVLKYNNASVEIKLKPSERDRYVMWSAPLKNMYSGDYHYRTSTLSAPMPIPSWGDVYMNYFQQANPDGGSAVANHFTASFGSLDQTLNLGRAFNLKVADHAATRDSLLRFPRTDPVYNYTNTNGLPATASVPRNPDSLKFITHGKDLDTHELFDLPVFGGGTGNSLVQVVNPYMAYLRISDFFDNTPGNTNHANFHSGYYIWDGDIKNGFTALALLNNGNRIEVTGNPAGPDHRLIPPLQSFFVAKKNPAAPVTSVVMSPNWTTTSPASSYLLRASAMVTNGGVLNITLSQGDKKACAAMLHTPGATSFSTDPEDMPVLVYKDIPLTLYTFAYDKPLVINSSGTFDMAAVKLGLRATDTGEAKLVFENLATFGYDVTLIDKALNNKQTNLNVTPEYPFTITKTGEINDRFSLVMNYTGRGVSFTGNEGAQTSALQVSGGAGYIHLKSNAGAIGHLQIYDATGKLIYSATHLNESQFRLPVNGKQVYLVKAATGSELITEKVFVK